MNQLTHRALLSAVMAIACFTGIASAQASPRVIKANIPFEFKVGATEFPAGYYSITEVEPGVLNVRDGQGHTVALALTHTVESANTLSSPNLQFVANDGRYALLEVWQGEGSTGVQLPRPKSHMKEVKQSTPDTQVVVGTY
jgi:hypothetical protein